MRLLGPHQQLAFIFGVLENRTNGSIVSFLVFLAPVQTFYKIYKKKTAEEYQSIPYMVALSSAMMLLYYGRLKSNVNLIDGTSSFRCAIEVIYLVLYIIYAPKKDKICAVYSVAVYASRLSIMVCLQQFLSLFIIYVNYKNRNKGVEITEQMQKVDMESSVGDIKPSFAEHEQIKEITIVIAEKPVESVEQIK
ncbi:bidirectional sugar transporter NEC1-like [Hibiscus syriacus]|uniref:bidirectional sugar transporter NEC1-like n=1 Tax=Hibiscus syriacus TaxID=106335 RepID=UPI0019242D2C|nr:bidirectional sugar transporter NEC1-like [Hibiscus syriacus]